MRKKYTKEDLKQIIADYHHKKLQQLFKGRPERDRVIDQEDMLNLRIALNTCHSLEEFIAVM